ncbi:MAG: phosphatidate cytidylyltransferase [Alistipes sp.]|nr:phosphatidate cytidylyltransferase [Alistipes sp.]
MSDKLKNLLVRTASGAVLLAIVAGASLSIYSYALLLFAIMVIGLVEFYKMARHNGSKPQFITGIATGIILFIGLALPAIGIQNKSFEGIEILMAMTIIFISLVIPICMIIELFKVSQTPMSNIATTILGIVYVTLPLSLMMYIPLFLGGNTWQPWYFLFYLFIVWANDVFAYLVGITMGKHRLCERISPKKSWEGFFGGIIGAIGVGALGAYFLDGRYEIWIGLAAIIAITGVLGDLVESMFKREAGVKDSGNIMPGHGGVLDRFDALLISAPFAFIFLLFL